MILCIDCGLTKGKLLLLTREGICRGEVSFHTPLHHEQIDTFALRSHLFAAIRELLAQDGCDAQQVSCITVSGHGNGLYLLGEKDVLPVGYSSMFRDSAPYLPEPGKTFPIILQTDWAGQPLPILAWVKDTKPEIYEQAKTILFCKDLLRWFLTGVAATEPTDASAAGLLDARTGAYSVPLLSVYGLEDAAEKLPAIINSDAVGGVVTETVSTLTGLRAGTPVLGGLFDVIGCMLGTGVINAGDYAMVAGTWGIQAVPSATLVETKEITQCCQFIGKLPYVCIDSAPVSCSNLEWFSQTVLRHQNYEEANQLVAEAQMDEELLYLPFLYAPMDMPKAEGGFVNLRAHHTAASMMRAVYEGIVFEHCRRLEKLKKECGECRQVILSGGGAKSPILVQMLADVCGINVLIPKQMQAGAMGGAIMALSAMGEYPDLQSAVKNLVQYQEIYRPNPENQAYYAGKYQAYLAALRRWQ